MWLTDVSARLRVLGATGLALTALGGCGSLATGYDHDLAATPTQNHQIKVEETPDRLAMTPHAEGLSPDQRIALIAFVGRWRESASSGDIAVQTPASGGDQAAIDRTASEVLGALGALGVPAQQIRTGDYDAPPGAERVLASFSSLQAIGPDCRGGWSNFTSTAANKVTEHFGCAVTANLAAQIADPRDLVSPAATTPGDAARRQTVLGKYRAGEVTSTPKDDQAVATISSAVGSQ